MGRVTGDKSRYNRKRRQKLARRVAMRDLAKTLATKGGAPSIATPPPRK